MKITINPNPNPDISDTGEVSNFFVNISHPEKGSFYCGVAETFDEAVSKAEYWKERFSSPSENNPEDN